MRGDDRAVAKHRHSVAKTPHLVQAVGNIEQAPALLFHAVNQREQPLAFLLIQRRRRLIEQQRPWFAAERADDFDDLLLGPAEPGDRHIDVDGDAKLCEVCYGLAPHLRLSEQSFLCNLSAEEQVFIDLERRCQAEILQDRIDPLLSGLRRRLMRCPPAVDLENAAVGRDGAKNDIDES